MTITRDKYKDVLKRICDKASKNGANPELYNEIYEDLDKVTDALILFASFFDNLVTIAIDNTLTHNDKITKITKMSFNGHHLTKSQAIDILNRLKKSENDALVSINDIDMDGGSNTLPSFKDESLQDMLFRGVNTRYSSTTKEATTTGSRLGRIFSYYLFRLPLTYILKFIYSLGGAPFKGYEIHDFDRSVPLTYYVLFLIGLMPIPIFGSIAGIFTDIYTFISAIDDGRIYLALITFVSGIMSLFILRAYDLGALFKIFYFMDVKHEMDYKNRSKRRSGLADMLNFTQTRPTDNNIVSQTMYDIKDNLNKRKTELETNLYNTIVEKDNIQNELERLESDEVYNDIADNLLEKQGKKLDKTSPTFTDYVSDIKRRLFGKRGLFGLKKGGSDISNNELPPTIDEEQLDELVEMNEQRKTELKTQLDDIGKTENELEDKIKQIESISESEIQKQAEALVDEAELKALRSSITDTKVEDATNKLIHDDIDNTEDITIEDNDEQPTTPEEQPTTTEELPPTTEDQPTTTEYQPKTTEDQPTTTEEEPTTPEEQPTTTEDQPTTTEDQPTTTEDQPTTTEELPTTTENQPTTTEELSPTTEDQPTTTEYQPKTTEDQPTTTEEQVTNTDKQTTIPQEKENMSDIVDEKEIERQEKLEELAKKEAQIQIDMDKEPETNIEETKNNDKQIVDETEIKKQKILQEQAEQIIKNDNELDELYKRTINDVKDIQTKSEDLFRQAYDIDNKKLETEPNNVQENKEVVPRIAEEEKTQISDIKGIYQEIKNPPPRIRALKQGGVLKFKRNSKSKSRKKKTK